MTILAQTPYYLAEYDACGGVRMLSIIDRCTGMGKAIYGPRIAGDFKDCIRTHGAERSIKTWLKIMDGQPWLQFYKPGVLFGREL